MVTNEGTSDSSRAVRRSEAAERLDRLADRYWQELLAANPLSATLLGVRQFDDRLPDLTADAEHELAARFADLAAEAGAIDEAQLDAQRRTSRSMLIFQAADDAAVGRSRLGEFTASAQSEGPQTALLQLPLSLSLDEPWQAEALVERLGRSGDYLDQACDRLRDGLATNRTPPRINVERAASQLTGHLASPLDDDPYLRLTPPAGMPAGDADRWRQRLRRAVDEVLRPALARYRDCLVGEVAPHARPDGRSGVCWLPDGEAVYATAVRSGTSLDLTADAIHAIGAETVEALADEYRATAPGVLGTDDLDVIFARLREDPALRFSSSDEVLAAAQAALDRAQAAVPAVFGRLPETACAVRPMADFEVEDGTIAHYLPPAGDGARPGTYFVNTAHPETRPRFEAEALAFHEAVPGHHLQIALAQELDGLPAFRRHALVNAYVEGWALYTERLADELGLYSGDLDRLGMLSFDSWRACRLVVDTGLHALGWSRDRAIAYMEQHSPLARNNIVNEVDRYLAAPGQALGYQLGKREILRLRDQARTRQDSRFQLAAFHDAVLGHGAVPLTTLAEILGS